MTLPAASQPIPDYLRPYIVKQDPSLYTAMDHAGWRFILRIAREFFAKHAHQKYLDGLQETGISSERIPLIEEIDERLRKFGWQAVAVSGFIPPAVFMEFLSRGILPIACDMRQLEHLAYTPAPDIVHEAAGHAPIIADPEYAQYLRNYGTLAEKAIFSSQDMAVYLAIRNLSEVKENPSSTPEQIEAAQKQLDDASAQVDYVSEASELARMSWWTIEYGLVGDPSDPKIYGAGLLSSLGESYHCLSPKVKRLPFNLECIQMSYDITRPQPQLYVARDFHSLSVVLEQLAATMAYRLGGVVSLEKAKKARTVTTVELDSGLQISGILADFIKGPDGNACYLKFQGPSQLSRADQQLDGQGADYHRAGYGTPLGKIKGLGKTPAVLTEHEFKILGFQNGHKAILEFESGVTVEGVLEKRVQQGGVNLVLVFDQCTVKLGSQQLFQPEWGKFDLGCGDAVVSVFGRPADRKRYLAQTGGYDQEPGKPKTNLTAENRGLNGLYAEVRAIREKGPTDAVAVSRLGAIHEQLERDFPRDWLLRIELLELDARDSLKAPWRARILQRLMEIAKTGPDAESVSELIKRGMTLL